MALSWEVIKRLQETKLCADHEAMLARAIEQREALDRALESSNVVKFFRPVIKRDKS